MDGILFCLGLANSRGMRAERLPDLINNSKVKEGKSSETFVSVKFNIQDWSPREDLPPLELDEDEISDNRGFVKRIDHGIFKNVSDKLESEYYRFILDGELLYGLFEISANSCRLTKNY